MRLDRCFNAADFRIAAKARLPGPLFDYIEGGADDEVTLRANSASFGRYHLVPSFGQDIRRIDLRRTVLGCDLAWPLILAPTGMSRMFHSDGERGAAAEAGRAGAGYALSTMATESIETIGEVGAGAKIYQLYLLKDDALNLASIDRARAAGYQALCITVDTIVAGNRERDLRSGLTVPPRLTPGSFLQFLARPGWCLDYAKAGRIGLPNVAGGEGGDLSTLAAFFAAKMERHIGWSRIERLAAHWGGPLAIKGVQTVEDVRAAAGSGATAAIISNHGGRQLDGGAATIDLIADIADAIGDRVELILDGGVRRGSHIAKALAMGARAVMIGRPYVYALAAHGAPGVARLLTLLHDELARTMALLGCASLDQLGRRHLRRADRMPAFLSEPAEPPAFAPQQWSRR